MMKRAAAMILVASALVVSPQRARAAELLVMDWNPRNVTKGDHGFPTERNNIDNSDWTKPVDYAHGTLYHRLEMRRMPTAKRMTWQYCFHEDGIKLEACGKMSPYFTGPTGGAPVVVTWTSDIASMWKLNGVPIDWSKPRSCAFVAIRKSPNEYISDYSSLNGGLAWAGEDPDDWYPMEVRFTVVVVSKGGTFSGWESYVGGGPTNKAPSAKNQSASVKQNGSKSITLSYSDSDGPSPYTFTITQSPSHGSLSGSGGTRMYTPNAGYSGSDSFKWKVTDGKGAESNVATVTIDVSGDADGDLLPNWWETEYGLDPNDSDSDGDGINDGAEDEDQDGRTNYEEYRAGSHPFVSNASVGDGDDVLSCGSPGAPDSSLVVAGLFLAALSIWVRCLKAKAVRIR